MTEIILDSRFCGPVRGRSLPSGRESNHCLTRKALVLLHRFSFAFQAFWVYLYPSKTKQISICFNFEYFISIIIYKFANIFRFEIMVRFLIFLKYIFLIKHYLQKMFFIKYIFLIYIFTNKYSLKDSSTTKLRQKLKLRIKIYLKH